MYVYIEPGVQFENERSSQNEQTLSRESVLVEEKVSFGHKGPRGWAEDEGLLG